MTRPTGTLGPDFVEYTSTHLVPIGRPVGRGGHDALEYNCLDVLVDLAECSTLINRPYH